MTALGREGYAEAVMLYAACRSVPDGTRLAMLDKGWLSSTVEVRSGQHLGCIGDLPNEFIKCR